MERNSQFSKNLSFFREAYRQKYDYDKVSLRAFAKAIGTSYDTYIRWEKKGWVPYRSNLDMMVRFLRSEFPTMVRISTGSLLNADLTKESVNIQIDMVPPPLPINATAIPVYSKVDTIPGRPREYFYSNRKFVIHTDFIINITDNSLKQLEILKGDLLEFQEGATSSSGIFLLNINNRNEIGPIINTSDHKTFFIKKNTLISISEDTIIIGQLLRINRRIPYMK